MSPKRGVWARSALVVAAAVIALRAAQAASPPLFLVDTPFDPLPSGIYVVDPATGIMTLRASIGLSYGAMLALAAVDDHVVYATGSDSNGCFSCFLYRITLDPGSTTPLEILPVGPVLDGATLIDGVTGLTFESDGRLWAVDEHTSGLFVVNPATAAATRIATVSTPVLGGDITFDQDGTLWLWSNAPSDHGLYEVDPATGAASLVFLRPDLRMAGLAALGHTNVLYGASPGTDALHEILIPSGFTGFQPPLVLNGSGFDHKRGDLDSPHCSNDVWCDDLDACTADACTPGGCTHAAPAGCCTTDQNCGDGNPCTDDACQLSGSTGVCVHVANAGTCDDGDACTVGDVCGGGACLPGAVDVPVEASGLVAASDKITYAWSAVPGATAYGAVRGLTDALPVGPGGGDEVCTEDLGSPLLVDADLPAPGAGFWYLVRGENACGVGTYGAQSNGTPRGTICP